MALQHTHELLKAICGRWHSPLFPQPRRHQQMVGVRTLNIKQPPFIFFPQVVLILQACFSAFFFAIFLFLYKEGNKQQKMAGSWTSAFLDFPFLLD